MGGKRTHRDAAPHAEDAAIWFHGRLQLRPPTPLTAARPAACVQGSDGLRCETLVPGRIGRASKAQEDPRPAATSSENAGREHFCHRTELLPDRAGAEGGAGCTPRAKSGLQTVRLNKALSASGHAHSWLPSRPKAGSRCRHRTTWPTKLKRFTIWAGIEKDLLS